MNVAGVMRRKATVVSVGAAVILAAVGVVVLANLNNPANGRLRDDGSLRTATVEKQWTVKRERYDACLDIEFHGKIAGNARSTWGITGPTTVWENLRVHDTVVSVDVRELSHGQCGAQKTVRGISVAQGWRTGNGDERGFRRTRSHFGGMGSNVESATSGMTVRLDGGSYDRHEVYRTTVIVYVDPNWRRNGGSITDPTQVEDTVTLPVG